MQRVTATTGTERYKTVIRSSDHTITGDEPVELGGQNRGMNPGELLCSSLASCTSITLRMYADRKEWKIHEINVTVFLNDEDKTHPLIHRTIEISGEDVDEQQQTRLLAIANACPVHKLLSRGIEIRTEMKF